MLKLNRRIRNKFKKQIVTKHKFFINNFSSVILHFFRQNFFTFSNLKLNYILFNPKLFLFSYFKSIKFLFSDSFNLKKSLKSFSSNDHLNIIFFLLESF